MNILSVTGGHRVDIDAFNAMMAHISSALDASWSHAFQPEAQQWLTGQTPFDVIVLHDIAGLFLQRGQAPTPLAPSMEVRKAWRDLTRRGIGLVVLHHALASWPSWDGWATAIGARFNYAPGTYRGSPTRSSGTRLESFAVKVVHPTHPVCDGVDDFVLDDEPYHFPINEGSVVALLRSNVDMRGERFVATYEHVLHGEAAAPNCAALGVGCNLVGWATSVGRSPIVVLQPGDNGSTFANASYRRLVRNAITWVGSDAGRASTLGGADLDTSLTHAALSETATRHHQRGGDTKE
jgi:uncharacterized protein